MRVLMLPHKPIPEDTLRALDAIRDAAKPVNPFAQSAELALCAIVIAQQLARATAIEVGLTPDPWETLPVAFQQKCLRQAERALVTREPDIRIAAAHEASREFAEWMNGPYTGQITYEQMAAKAIGFYEQQLAHPEALR